jgi:hypothetical protein
VTYRKRFISIWNEIKKIPSLTGKMLRVDQLNDTTVLPFILNFFKNFSADYKKNKSNNWDYLISRHEFRDLNQPCNRLEKIDYLIKQYNQRLLFYSGDKANPWVINDQEKNFITLRQKKHLAVEEEPKQVKVGKNIVVCYSKEREYIQIYACNTIWERANNFLVENKVFRFFEAIWNTLSAHANLLNWISLLFLFFSLSLYSFPVVFILIAVSVVSYLLVRFIFLVKKKSSVFPDPMAQEAEKLLERVKIDVFNAEKNKEEFSLLQNYIGQLAKDGAKLDCLDRYINILFSTQKKLNSNDFLRMNLEESSIYQYLEEVYPKTQFIASLIINLSSVLLYTYLLTWAINGFLTVVGATTLAGMVASPLAVGILILAVAGFFLIRQLFQFRAREDYYQRTIFNSLNEKCEYRFRDSRGEPQVIQLEKWKKFEHLRKNIRLIELEIKPFLENEELDDSIKKLYLALSNRVKENRIYESSDQDRLLGGSASSFKKIKKIFNRFFAFSDGIFCGFDLSQQIVWKSSLGIRAVNKASLLPLLVFFIPFIMVTAIVNLLTYHLNSRQRDRFNCAKNLDSKIEILEQSHKKILYLAALLKLKPEDSSIDSCSGSIEHQIIEPVILNNIKVATTNISSSNSPFFSVPYAKRDFDLNQHAEEIISLQMGEISKAR